MMMVMVMERYEGRKGVARANQTGAAKVTKPPIKLAWKPKFTQGS